VTQTRLSVSEREEFQHRMREMQQRLTGEVGELEAEALRPAAESPAPIPAAHEADRAVRDAEEEVTRTLLVSEGSLLADVEAALERFGAGTFGQCERCGKPISRARLVAIPYARACVRCARAGSAE
jgi:RNA polymerase-binding transcription factor DksA